jgi:hypothetical protein
VGRRCRAGEEVSDLAFDLQAQRVVEDAFCRFAEMLDEQAKQFREQAAQTRSRYANHAGVGRLASANDDQHADTLTLIASVARKFAAGAEFARRAERGAATGRAGGTVGAIPRATAGEDMRRTQIEAALRTTIPVGQIKAIVFRDERTYVELGDDATLEYGQLLKLSEKLGTTDINIVYERGFGGTDVTPADRPVFELSIGVTPDEEPV